MKTCKAGYCTVAILPLLDGLFSSRMLAPAALALRVRECYFDPLRRRDSAELCGICGPRKPPQARALETHAHLHAICSPGSMSWERLGWHHIRVPGRQ